VFKSVQARIAAAIQSRLVRDEEGATAVEYGLIVGLIAIAIIAAMAIFAPAITSMFTEITGGLGSVDLTGGE
jgi:pilus assembly protein Flp/PilA